MPASPALRTGTLAPQGWRAIPQQAWWPWVSRGIVTFFLLGVVWLLVKQARTVDWPQVLEALRALPASALWIAGALAAASHVTYGSFDLIGRRCTRHTVPRLTTMGIAMTSYAFTLNLGSLVGGVGIRYRLYERRGVEVGTIGQVVGLGVLTNWIGYFLLAAALPWLWEPHLPSGWSVPGWQLRWACSALLLVPAAYLALCALRHGKAITLKGHSFPLPRWPLALWQLVVSAGNWMLMAGALWWLLQHQVPYPAVLATVLVAAVSGLVLRIPAGLGVLEAVGVLLLAGPLSHDTVLAALLAYRALYYFAPLVLAALAFGVAELHQRQSTTRTEEPA